MNNNKFELEYKLTALKIPGAVIDIKENPFYMDYIIQFDPTITINKIRARMDDIKLFFGYPVELVIEKNIIFRIAKKNRPCVDLLDFKNFILKSKNPLPLAMGIQSNGQKLVYDLAKMPHLLIAGATGQGKSVFINNCILSLLWANNTGLCMIDLKRVELSKYNRLKALKSPIATDIRAAEQLLINLCYEMDFRYKKMERLHCSNFDELQKKDPKIHRITLIIDEFGDLILENKSLEYYIIRLAQLARAAGIHLILATQRPSVDVLTGLIKANIPSRIAFTVSSAVDSRIIIDRRGAEDLTGRGDALFLPIGAKDPERLQTPYIDNDTLLNELKFYNKR